MRPPRLPFAALLTHLATLAVLLALVSAPLHAADPPDFSARRELAESYASQGLVEEAIAEYLAILKLCPDDEQARTRSQDLFRERMPAWLPAEAEQFAPFPHSVLDLKLTDPTSGQPVTYRVLRTDGAFFAPGDEVLLDPIHHWRYLGVDYGYLWNPSTSKWTLVARSCQQTKVDPSLARDALTGLLVFHAVARDYARLDPTRPHGEPLNLWLTTEGSPGGESVGRSIYLTAVDTPRAPAEWLREMAHEYGHIAFPGMGGFAKTDDPWVDGDLGELLLIKWAAANSQPAELSWSLREAEAVASARRCDLISRAAGKPNPARLQPMDRAARDYFLGLALRVEAAAGPRFLAEALARCPRGRPGAFLAAANSLAKERRLTLWR